LELSHESPVQVESASALIDEKIKELGDWRGKTLAKVCSHGGIVCTRETYKHIVKMTFAKGAALKDPSVYSTPASTGMSGAPSTSTKATRSMRRP
jgi:hypothetical protein